MAMLLKNRIRDLGSKLGNLRTFHVDVHVPFRGVIGSAPESVMVLPESIAGPDRFQRIEIPNSSCIGSIEVMAVPKKKVSPHKRGIRNGPKALKPIPVIIRCKACGRVKLPHFYCCSGIRGSDGKNSPNN